MLVMEDRRKEVKAILCEELDNLRQRIIENHIRLGSVQVAKLSRACTLSWMIIMVLFMVVKRSEFWRWDVPRGKYRKDSIRLFSNG